MNGIPRQDTLPGADVVQSRPDWTQPGQYRTNELPWRWLHAAMAVVDSAGSRGDSHLPGVEASSENGPSRRWDRSVDEATASFLGQRLWPTVEHEGKGRESSVNK